MRTIRFLLLTAAAVGLSACSVNIGAQVGKSKPPIEAALPPPAPVSAPAPVEAKAEPENDPRLLATLYMQQAEELRRLSKQSYALATLRLPNALKQPGSSALEQTDGGKGKPPAAIFDVDETVLDNSPHQARAILSGTRKFDENQWDQWIGERAATPVPGAVDFVKELRRNKVRVVYITNRECRPRVSVPNDPCPQHADTLANLNAVGLGPVAPEDLLLKGQNNWPAEKAPRRQEVIQTHRIIMSLGDQFSDLMSVTRNDKSEARPAIAAMHEDLWNTRWIVIPNPTYGQWVDILPVPISGSLRTK